MAKKLSYSGVLYLCAGASALAVLLFAILGFAGIISPLASILVCSLSVLGGATAIVLVVVFHKKALKKHEQEKIKAQLIARNNYLKQLYDILKIPYQYDEDGHIKDIYELLKIKPIYDENGKQIPLIYELLKIMPRFDKNGRELPSVFAIKNRVKKVAKGILSPIVLTYKPKAKIKEEQPEKEPGKKEEKAPAKDVKAKAKEVSKKPAKKAGDKGATTQSGLVIKVKPKAIDQGIVKNPGSNRSGLGGGYGSYKNETTNFNSLIKGQAGLAPKAPETSSEPLNAKKPPEAKPSQPTGAVETFEGQNLDATTLSYIFDEEREK